MSIAVGLATIDVFGVSGGAFDGSCVDGGDGVLGGGDGVRGGGGCPSEDSQACLAAASSTLAKGSNSLRTSLDTGVFEIGEAGAELDLRPLNIDCCNEAESGRVTGRPSPRGSSRSPLDPWASLQGLGDAGKSDVSRDDVGAGEVEDGGRAAVAGDDDELDCVVDAIQRDAQRREINLKVQRRPGQLSAAVTSTWSSQHAPVNRRSLESGAKRDEINSLITLRGLTAVLLPFQAPSNS